MFSQRWRNSISIAPTTGLSESVPCHCLFHSLSVWKKRKQITYLNIHPWWPLFALRNKNMNQKYGKINNPKMKTARLTKTVATKKKHSMLSCFPFLNSSSLIIIIMYLCSLFCIVINQRDFCFHNPHNLLASRIQHWHSFVVRVRWTSANINNKLSGAHTPIRMKD